MTKAKNAKQVEVATIEQANETHKAALAATEAEAAEAAAAAAEAKRAKRVAYVAARRARKLAVSSTLVGANGWALQAEATLRDMIASFEFGGARRPELARELLRAMIATLDA